MARRLLLLSLLLLAFAALTYLPAAADHDFPQQVTDLINSARAREGLPPLRLDARLTSAAQAHSEDMAAHATVTHTGSDGSSSSQRMTRAGYDWTAAAECVAGGQSTAEWVVADWMNSPPHRRVLMGDYRDIGIGYAYSDAGYQHYWTADLGSTNATPALVPTKPATPTSTPSQTPSPTRPAPTTVTSTRTATPTLTRTPSQTPVDPHPPLASATPSATATARFVIQLMFVRKQPMRTSVQPGPTPPFATVVPYP